MPMAGLRAWIAMVWVGPPLFLSPAGSSKGSTPTLVARTRERGGGIVCKFWKSELVAVMSPEKSTVPFSAKIELAAVTVPASWTTPSARPVLSWVLRAIVELSMLTVPPST